MDDNKKYEIDLPKDDDNMYKKFVQTIEDIINFRMENYIQYNKEKCLNCIYEPACDRSLCEDDYMISIPEFESQQVLLVFSNKGDKISFSRPYNIVVKDKDNKS